jgi:hypothetical protein
MSTREIVDDLLKRHHTAVDMIGLSLLLDGVAPRDVAKLVAETLADEVCAREASTDPEAVRRKVAIYDNVLAKSFSGDDVLREIGAAMFEAVIADAEERATR